MKTPVIQDSIDHVSEKALRGTGLKLIPPPALLMVVRGMILAHSVPVGITTVPVTINQDMKALRFQDGIDTRFGYYLLTGIQDLLLADVEIAGHGTCRLPSDRWKNLEFYLPPESEQRTIVDFLDRETARIDDLIAQKERLLGLLEEQRMAMITRAVTKGLDPDVEKKDSGVEWIGAIPESWEVTKLGLVTNFVQTGPFGSQLHARDYEPNQIPVINPSNITSEQEIKALVKKSVPEQKANRLDRHRMKTDDVVMARRGELGRCAVVKDHQEGWLCGTGCIRIQFQTDVGDPQYFAQILATSGTKEWLQLQSVGATMLNLNESIVRQIPTPLPPAEVQKALTQWISQTSAKINGVKNDVKTALRSLKEYRTALISAAVTGKIDVREET